MEYIYTDIENTPDLLTNDEEGNLISGIHYDVINSEMTNKSIEYCTWNKNDEILHVIFTNELSNEDKTILDSIIQNNI